MTNNDNHSKRKAMSQVIEGCIRPTKGMTKRSSQFVPDPATSARTGGEATPPLPPPFHTRSDANIVHRTPRHVQEQPSDNHESERQDQGKDEQPFSSCQQSSVQRTKLHHGHHDTIRKIQAEIAMTEAKQVEARNTVTALDNEINEAETELMAIAANKKNRPFLLVQPHKFSPISRRATQEYFLRCKVKDLWMIRNIAAKREENFSRMLDSLKVQLGRAGKPKVTVRTGMDKKVVVRRESGIVYLPEHRRIGMIRTGTLRDFGLVQMENARVRLKEIPVAENVAPMLEKVWALHSMDISKKEFYKELVKLLPRLSKKMVRNAWLALNLHYEGEETITTATESLTHQQGVYMPFTMLLMAATAEDGLVNSSFKTGQDVYSSLSIAYKEDGRFHERKLAIPSSAAATLYQGWDAFGVMEIKRTDGSELMEYDRCVLMTAVTAVALKRFIKASDYDKIALPFLIWSGYHASLHVTRLDPKGSPMVGTVRYPSGEDGSGHDLSKSPCVARTKLFLAFAVLLDEFKAFFESSVKTRYNETIQKCIPLIERMTEYTPMMEGDFSADRSRTKRRDQDHDGKGRKLARGASHNAPGTAKAPMTDREAAQSTTCSRILPSLAYDVEIIMASNDTGHLARRIALPQEDSRGCSFGEKN